MESSSQKGLRKGAWAEEEDILLRKCIMEYGEGKWHQVPLRAGLNRCRKSCRLRWLNYLQPNIVRGEFKPDEVDLIIRMHKLLGNRQVYTYIFQFLQELKVIDMYIYIAAVGGMMILWSLIAGRLPGRTANDIKNYYNTHLKKTCFSKYNPEMRQQVAMSKKSGHGQDHDHSQILKRRRQCPKVNTVDLPDDIQITQVLRPQPRTLQTSQWNMNKVTTLTGMNNSNINNSQVFDKNVTKCLPFLVDDDSLKQFSNDQQLHNNNSIHWVKNILFGEMEEEAEDPMPNKKKKKNPKKKKRVTFNNNAVLISESNTTKLGVEEGCDDQNAFYCSADDNFWNSYLDDDLWRAC
ncbi:hypothetical protein MKX01_031195 [Papaver californicum]|nr:hypothetical protein MKX01_031195 [Papaver californicum]